MIEAAERDRALQKIRELRLAFPETSERLSHGAPTFLGIAEDAYLEVAPARLVESVRRGESGDA